MKKVGIKMSKCDAPLRNMIFMNKYFLFGGMFLLDIKLYLIKQLRKAKLPSKRLFLLKLSEQFYELKTAINL